LTYTKEQIEKIVALKKQGMSHRDISEVVFKRRTSASSVFYVLNEHLSPLEKKVPQEGPKVLLFDLETSPELGYVWGRFKQFLAPVQVKQRSFLLTWSAKWLGKDEVMWDGIPWNRQAEVGGFGEEDDLEIVSSIWRLLDDADVVIAHNGNRFDIPYLNSRFAYHGLGMPSPYKAVDTFKIAKKYFRFPANSLKELGIYLGCDVPKLDTDFQLWIDCMAGKQEAWEYMVEYNQYDVNLLEQVYMKLRPYDKTAPNFALYYDDDAVRDPVTGSTEVVKLDKLAYTATSAFESFRSNEGHVFRSSKRVKGVKHTNSQ
jgi:DNA polymerase elongation subunit (family B)